MKCDNDLLWTLVQQDAEPGEEAESVALHVESCQTCQQTLSKMGGEFSWWNDARKWLSDVEIDPAAAHRQEHEHQPLPPIDLKFLDAPAHPEMLGRIGRYDVEGVLGRGGMGVVLRAYDSDLHRSVAVKVLAPEWAASVQARQRFAREAQAAASVAHENVIPIFDVEPDAKLPYLVMRYVPGMTLQRWVQAHGPPDVATILRVAGQLAEGLAAAHRRGLVHRDIKPANVLVGKNTDRVWITDFGLARAADSVTLTRTGVIAGTPHYMSPEQTRGEPLDHRSDLFSLGCVLYFLATGRPPFDADNTLAVLHKIVSEDAVPLASLRSDLPPSFASLVQQMLARKRHKRQPDCTTVIGQLKDAQIELHDGRSAKPPLPKSMRRWITVGATAVVLSMVAWFGWMATSQPSSIGSLFGQRTLTADPFQMPVDQQETFSPYLIQASAQIDFSTSMDSRKFAYEIERLKVKVDQLSASPQSIQLPLLKSEGNAWKRQIAEMQRRIEVAKTK
ncbi:MAG: serine/threonine-protein kinase [Rubripirellula sp.]